MPPSSPRSPTSSAPTPQPDRPAFCPAYFQAAANVARSRVKQQRRQVRLDDLARFMELQAEAPDAERALLCRERLTLLGQTIRELPPRCREVFLMSRRDGLSHGEIAARLGISRNMVEKHILGAAVTIKGVCLDGFETCALHPKPIFDSWGR